ncbi:MAG: glutaredoxin family protein [Candidatus Magasanikbacteria bacterium]|nr:glutaredoxin family protein [Candidatus Magasanikbacteria bacterium]
MKRIFFLFVFLLGLILIGAGCGTGGARTILFVGDGCPHCAKVEEFLEKNKVGEKINLETLEVYKNQANANLMAAKAKVCGLSLESIGVPFLWADSKCLIGDADIISFFEEKLKAEK